MKIDKADRIFSYYIRLRDKKCSRCSSSVRLNDKRLPISHTTSHYFGRSRENVRYDPTNCTTLCMACHRIWASDDRETYRRFMIDWLGKKEFEHLCIRAETYSKKDRKLAYIYAKSLLDSLKDQKDV